MNPIPNSESQPTPVVGTPNRSFWKKLGGGSLSISLIFHVVLLAIGVIWVFQIIPQEQAKVVNFLGKSGGGGSPASETKVKQQRVQMAQPDLSRIVAVGATGISLPEPLEMPQMTSLGGLPSSGLASGQGGSGSGGKGDGNGPGFGSGFAPGMNTGKGTKNPFGMLSAGRGALVGTFYDFKQTDKRKPTGMTDSQFREEIREIVKGGLRESAFRKYFKAPRELFQTKFHIPLMPADAAPVAFEVEKEVQPKRWAATYRGAVQAPKSGKFRFVGAGDDILLVRFNNRLVFDYGYTLASSGTDVIGRSEILAGNGKDDEFLKSVRRSGPMRPPITFYKYSTTPNENRNIGGVAVGPEFDVAAGRTYPIEILISEIPGGQFSVTLLIEEIGATYHKDTTGSPILPLFQLDNAPPVELKGETPPYAPDGPIWKYAGGVSNPEI